MISRFFRERRRATAVRALGLIDLPAEPAFDRFVAQAAHAFDAPLAFLSLIHDDTQSVMAAHGFPIRCLSRGDGFCGFSLDRDDLLECCDARLDPRFATLPSVVGAPHVRYYLGAPLRLLSGVDVGALCIADMQVRPPASADQRAYMAALARQAAMELEARGELHQAGIAA